MPMFEGEAYIGLSSHNAVFCVRVRPCDRARYAAGVECTFASQYRCSGTSRAADSFSLIAISFRSQTGVLVRHYWLRALPRPHGRVLAPGLFQILVSAVWNVLKSDRKNMRRSFVHLVATLPFVRIDCTLRGPAAGAFTRFSLAE